MLRSNRFHRLLIPIYYDANTYVLSTDGDMWNLDRAHFHTRSSVQSVQLFYANAYSYKKDSVMYPICYIGTTADRWLEIMRPVLSLVVDNLHEHDRIAQSLQPSSIDSTIMMTIDASKRRFELRALLLRLVAYGANKYGRQWTAAGKAVSPQWYFDQLLFGDAIRLQKVLRRLFYFYFILKKPNVVNGKDIRTIVR